MSALFSAAGPRVFYVPPGVDFAGALARGLRTRLTDAPPERITQVSLTLNTLRMARAFRARMLAQSATGACWLPRISLLSELGAGARPDLPPPIAPEARLLALTRLIEAALRREPALGPVAGAPRLAASLAALLDEFGREGVALDALIDAPPADHAAHWELSLIFLRILSQVWPSELARLSLSDPAARRRAEIAALTESWAAAPPQAPTLLAGGTGSVAVTAALMRAVAALPEGAVILPGFDPAQTADWWGEVAPGHPYAAIRSFLDGLSLRPEDVEPWSEEDRSAPARARLLAEALRPAPATDGWLAARADLATQAAPACAGLTLIEAPSPRREAESVALAMRAEIEAGRRAELITPDRALARRVAAELERWGIAADDSAGRPLGLTPPAVFLRLLTLVGFTPYDPADLLALLKHPLCGAGDGRNEFLKAARGFELAVLRRNRPPRALAACRAHEKLPDALAPALDALLALAGAAASPASLDLFAAAHLRAAEALAGPKLWADADGRAVRKAVEAFAQGGALYGAAEPDAYPALFGTCLTGAVAGAAERADPRAAILGGLESRAGRADLTILGGLNEGVWPPSPEPDPWLNRAMRGSLGLPSPERRTGLAAHDFLNAACAPRVILTRSERAEGKPTEASRLLRRLTTLTEGVAGNELAAMRARGAEQLALTALLDPPPETPQPAPRPAPKPGAAARPRRLPVTAIETLIRDPYAVYARYVLRLRALDPLSQPIDAAARGEALHAVMARYGEALRDGADDPAAAFDAACAQTLPELAETEAARRLWAARLARLREVFLLEDRARLAQGRPAALEQKGERLMDAPALSLTATADRIDQRRDGRLAIYDYKGGPPSKKQVEIFAKQLPLEAAIARAGGFAGLAAAEVAELAFLSLKDGETRALDGPGALADEAWAGLAELIAAYDAGAPWLSRARPKEIKFASDYDHLARYGEWRDGQR